MVTSGSRSRLTVSAWFTNGCDGSSRYLGSGRQRMLLLTMPSHDHAHPGFRPAGPATVEFEKVESPRRAKRARHRRAAALRTRNSYVQTPRRLDHTPPTPAVASPSIAERFERPTADTPVGVSVPNVDCDEPRLTGGTSFRTMRLRLVELAVGFSRERLSRAWCRTSSRLPDVRETRSELPRLRDARLSRIARAGAGVRGCLQGDAESPAQLAPCSITLGA